MSQFGLTGFEVQYWDGSGWITVPNGSVSSNNKIWRKFTFSPISTSKIRVLANASVDGYSRLTEIEAYGPADLSSSTRLHWLISDHLGTPRLIFDQTGDPANVSRRDYLPFGEELLTAGGRSPEQGYASEDGLRQQFTSKERDVETGLDYFLARYYSSTQDRFTSPDEFSGGPTELFADVAAHNPTFYAELAEPQSLNKYHYCLNNPLKFIDPDGHQGAVADALHSAANQTQPIPVVSGAFRLLAVGVGAATVAVTAGPAILDGNAKYGRKNPLCPAISDGCVMQGDSVIFNKSNDRNAPNPNQQAQGQSNTGSPNPDDKKPVFGEKGTQTTSTTVYNGKGERIDVENPNPGQRAGQIHYQSGNTKLLYDPNSKSFVGASKSLNKRLMEDPQIQKAIKKGLKILGEDQ